MGEILGGRFFLIQIIPRILPTGFPLIFVCVCVFFVDPLLKSTYQILKNHHTSKMRFACSKSEVPLRCGGLLVLQSIAGFGGQQVVLEVAWRGGAEAGRCFCVFVGGLFG